MARSGALAAAVALTALAAGLAPARPVAAWGATGHRLIAITAVRALPSALPGFLRSDDAALELGELAREPDRGKGTGKPHDPMRDPAHFLDVDEKGEVLGGPRLDALPETFDAYDAALRAAGHTPVEAGWLPYAIQDAWQQLAKDMGYWRVLDAAERRAIDPARRAWFATDRRRRETLTLVDLGLLAHYVGDGSQPMHVSVHYNGWGPSPNPHGFTQSRIHAPFEGALVRQIMTETDLAAALPAPAPCACSESQRIVRYLQTTAAEVEPLYALEAAGGLKPTDPRAKAFVTERLAAAAAELRDMTASAWDASEDVSLGYPAISVRDVEAGKIDPFDALYGLD